MTDLPILVTAREANVLWRGIKTQIRRPANSPLARCQPGDRLYVREPWRSEAVNDQVGPSDLKSTKIFYAADHIGKHGIPEGAGRIRSGMFLPREMARQTLSVISARFDFLHRTTEADAIEEGMGPVNYTNQNPHFLRFKEKWDTHHPDHPWEANPEIIVLNFARWKENIDQMKEFA